MTAKKPSIASPETTKDEAGRRVITDAKVIRAMAHPVRLALLDAMRTEGEITATQAAQLLDDSPGNMSWHLQTLAKYGFIEEVEGAKGRSRPWRLASANNRFTTAEGDESARAAGQVLQMTVFERSHEQMREWWAGQGNFSTEWRKAAFMTDSITYLTAHELEELSEQFLALISKFNDRIEKAARPADAIPVHLNLHGHPLVTQGTPKT
jgi:predicted ArsR family transcriptional regulator